jgi:hypothetical protein
VSGRPAVRFLDRSLSFAPFCYPTIALLDLDGSETFLSLTGALPSDTHLAKVQSILFLTTRALHAAPKPDSDSDSDGVGVGVAK